MVKKLTDSSYLGGISVVDSENNIDVLREHTGKYIITEKYPSGDKNYAIISFKDKGDHVKVEAIVHNYMRGNSSKNFFIHKKTGSVKEARQKQSTEIVYGDGRVAGDYKVDENELKEMSSVRHIHKIVDEKHVYRAILEELNKIDGLKNLGTLLHEFHEHAEPEYHKRMSGENLDIIETTKKAAVEPYQIIKKKK